ncbi:CLUMA_CG013326, isoform A [Clunio marinus]|uniref:CLUMA_CG013326, isoform A n=1 Tax=Clunio marinus TaxID=568069 RepID=A0A1J1ILU3_9DIPT|nr:CLUMA_CG013326, isoform A [Clunio marinus]
MNFIEIQSWPEIPSIGFFVSLFSSSFNLPDFDIEDLEEALLLDSSESNSIDDSTSTELTPRLIPELIVTLLRGCDSVKSWENITTSNYQMFLRRLFRNKCEKYGIENPFNTDTDFHSLSLRTKVVILNYLCDFRLDSSDVECITSNFDSDSLRIEPLGYDSNGSAYWYFFGTRLYREDFQKNNSNKRGRNVRIWQVICFTEQDWQNLANRFKDSKSKKEISLHKILTEDFLPNIPVLFKAKEAERRRRLFQRRSSLRVKGIIEKRKEKESAKESSPIISEEDSDSKLSYTEKYLEEKKKKFLEKSKIREKIQNERAVRAQRRSSSSSSSIESCNHMPCYDEKFKSIAKEYFYSVNQQTNSNNCLSNKENILHSNLFDTKTNISSKMPPIATKLPGRQTNNSLSSITGQIVIETTAAVTTSGPSTSRKKKTKAEVFMDTDEVLQIGMHKVLQHVKNHDDAWPFMDPVEEDIAPRYYSIIKRPMDLLKMEEKLDNGEYRTFTEFRTDFKLIVNNCRLYNGQNNEYTEMVNNLQQAFDRATKKYFDQTSSDEDPVLLEYPPIDTTTSKPNTSKEIAVKKEKSKTKNKKHSKLSSNNSSIDEDDKKSSDVGSYKKVKDSNKHKIVVDHSNNNLVEKKTSRLNENDKKKEKSTKGVKRKHREKEKSAEMKAKKMKRDHSSSEKHFFEFDSDHDSEGGNIVNNDEELSRSKAKKITNKVENVTEQCKDKSKVNKKNKKDENIKLSGNKKQQKSVKTLKESTTVASDVNNKKNKKDYYDGQKKEKFSKTNEKANKKRKMRKNSDSDSDNSVHDLIEDKKSILSTKKNSSKKEKLVESTTNSSSKKSNDKKSDKAKSEVKKKKSKKSHVKESSSFINRASCSRSPSPLNSLHSSAITDDLTDLKNSSFRSDTPEIKDKFDLIKERRNKISQEKMEKNQKNNEQHSTPHAKEKNHKLKETIEKLKIKNDKSKSQIELIDEVLGGKVVKKDANTLFDELKNEGKATINESKASKGGASNKKKAEKASKEASLDNKSKKLKTSNDSAVLDKVKVNDKTTALNITSNVNQSKKNKKQQNKACLDVLDMETEQTLKDINKWLEHTPRFEYSSASNSPSRYIIDEIEMPSKMDDNDFRKPIPLMPSSPSASQKPSLQNTPKEFNLLKESNNNKQPTTSQHPQVPPSTSTKKVITKDPKRKSLREKLQQLPRKKELQRTIDRLQPGKTKGNLLHNIQNVNKPEELFPLGNREKVKEIKNSLIVQTDESSPKLSLGTVLDTQAFNFSDNDCKKSDSDYKIEQDVDDVQTECVTEMKKSEEVNDDAPVNAIKNETTESSVDNNEASKGNNSDATKPNINAWFKAFGVPKKPKKSESQDELTIPRTTSESSSNDLMRKDGNFIQGHRRLSTGSSMSERSSVEDSPQVGLEERLGAPAPYPSPIGSSPIMASPKTDDNIKSSSSNYPMNGSIRVGFYQDMTSTKSSPEKSCSPREMPSPYSQYSQHQYPSGGNSGGSSMYGNFYNPENLGSNKQLQQASYSKPTKSPASYYDQYKQPMSQESEFNNSMSPSTNPNSPYHSQQSSPYQQQPNSPFQAQQPGGTSNSGNNATTNISQSPSSPYSPNSTFQQSQQQQQQPQTSTSSQQTQNPSSSSSSSSSSHNSQNSPINNQNLAFPNAFNQQQQQQHQFTTSTQSQECAKLSEWNKKTNNASSYGLSATQHGSNFNPSQVLHQQAQQQLNHQHMLNSSNNNAFPLSHGAFNKRSPSEVQTSGTPATTPLYGTTSKLPDLEGGYGGSSGGVVDMVTKLPSSKEHAAESSNNNNNKAQVESSKYLDLSKQTSSSQLSQQQQQQQAQNQYQQMFDLTNYSKPQIDFDIQKSKSSADIFNRSLQKSNLPISASACAVGAPNFWNNSNPTKPMEAPSYDSQSEVSKNDLSGKPIVNALLNAAPGNSFFNNSVPHQQATRNSQPPPTMDINYKQPIFNNPAASSMMDLTAFMRDFRQAEERFSSLSGASTSFYDKNIAPAHMFGKNLQQANSSAALQQMFNNSMTTMAYNRESQNMNLANYHNRLNTPQAPVPTPSPALNATITELKVKKQRKKKNASPDVAPNNIHVQNQQLQHSQTHQHPQQQQQAHQQSFQSYPGLKIPSASAGAQDPSAIALKSVVPGSAFNYGPTPIPGLYGENPAYLDEFQRTSNPYYPPTLSHRSTPDPSIDKVSANPPPAHPQAASSPYHHLLPPHHPSRSSYPFMNSLMNDPAALQQQYRMMLNQTYQAGYHSLGMHNQPPHWPHHM